MSSFVVLPILMQSTGRIADENHYLYYFWLLLASFVAMLPFVYLTDRKGLSKSMLLVMIVVFLGASVSFSMVRGYYAVLVTMVAFFMAFNLLESVLPALVSKLAPAGRRGTAMGIFSTAQFAGGFFGGVAGGFLLGRWELADVMYANAAICLLWLVATLGMPAAGNYRTVTCRLDDHESLSTSEVADALLSVHGVVDVALLEDERLAYLKVDRATWDEAGLSGLAITAAPVAK
ncbi:MAG: MFS transporter [Gammaproteobacteria bacterium]|nr:MFS transporter [Gammaproteobacteria bacterium]